MSMPDAGPSRPEAAGPTRAEMEQALARQFGYADYASFREGVAQTLGTQVLRRLEKQLEKYGPPPGGGPGDTGSG